VEVACESESGNGRLSETCCKPVIMAMMSELGNSFLKLEMSLVLVVARKVDALKEVQQKTCCCVSFSSQRGQRGS